MGYIILIIIALIIAFYLIVYVIAPISGVLFVITSIIALGYAFCVSIYSFVKSLSENINPYDYYRDKNVNAPPGVKRNYFFGPGYKQISETVSEAFSEQKDRVETITDFKDRNTGYHRHWFIKIWVWTFFIIAWISTFIFGFAWIIVFSVILSLVIFTGMCIFYPLFSLLWIADRLTLMIKSIHSRCGNCKKKSIVPIFVCPDCGTEHKNLTPGAYGTFKRKCTCGKKLPTTFFSGRSKLDSSCPFCATELAASGARQLGIQLVGGVSAGKTTFLAAFWHMYIERLKRLHYMSFDIFPTDAFKELEHWYQQGLSSSTTETNANMYSIIHKRKNETPCQVTIYDIAGEAFTDLGSDIQQQQFKYCEGIIIIIDPTVSPRKADETISSFLNEFRGLKGKHSSKTADIPVAVLISKADLFKRDIGLPKIRSRLKTNPNEFLSSEGQSSFELVRNGVCREFLENNGFGNVRNIIDGEFISVQYYPVSAMGHEAIRGEPYEPWGVIEPVMWLLSHSDESFVELTKHIQEVMV